MANDNTPENTQLTILEDRVDEMEARLREALNKTSALTWNHRNWEAVKQEMEVQQQRFKTLEMQIESVKNLVMSMQIQFQQFQQQRAIELDQLLHGRQTVKDDNEGS